MAQFSKTWWGQEFITALEKFTDSNRLGRGRSYARNGKIKKYQIKKNKISAKVRGSVNPYFDVYEEPLYDTGIAIEPISGKDWQKAIAHISSKASLVAKLLMNEVPENIEKELGQLNLHLLPQSRQDFHTECSCPDYSNPCKHIAGVYYLVASELDEDPFLLFELRGLSRKELHQELTKSPLGQALSSSLVEAAELEPEPVESYYTKPTTVTVKEPISPREFWQGKKSLPSTLTPNSTANLPALVVKKGGDYPPFWQQDRSFLGVMEEFYERVRKKHKL